VTCYQQQAQPSGSSNHSSRQQHGHQHSLKISTSIEESPEMKYLQPYSLRLAEFENDSVRGIQTLVDRNKDDILMKIPLYDTITTDPTNTPDEDERVAFLSTQFSVQGEEERLAIMLLYLRYIARDSYVTTVLPKQHYGIWNLPQPIWDALRLPKCYKETFDATRIRVTEYCNRIMSQQQESQSTPIFTFDDCMWSFSMVRSRSIAVPELIQEKSDMDDGDATSTTITEMPLALIPGLDLFNHKFQSGTKMQLVHEDDGKNQESSWIVSSSDSYKADDQIYLSYGDDKDNWKLLLTYGFAVSQNPNSLIFWTWDDLLDAASSVKPTIFTDRIIASLKRHPQLQMYTTVSENRPTFSYDSSLGKPRESLLNGLTMVSNLHIQLGGQQEEDGKLEKEVLEQLIKQRIFDLELSHEEITKYISELNESKQHHEWIPLLKSITVALKQELNDLSTVSTKSK
jgi:hypothetical protein